MSNLKPLEHSAIIGCILPPYHEIWPWDQKGYKTKKNEKPENQETLHKSCPGLMFMGFWQEGMVGNNSRMDSPRIIVTSEITKHQKHLFSCYFLNIGGGPRKADNLPTAPNNQFRDYFIRNRIEKLVSLNWNFAPQTLKPKNK